MKKSPNKALVVRVAALRGSAHLYRSLLQSTHSSGVTTCGRKAWFMPLPKGGVAVENLHFINILDSIMTVN